MLSFDTPSASFEMDVINVSVGGASGVFGNFKKGTQKDLALKVGEILDDLQLEFPSKKEDLRVHIKKCLIKRVERDPQTKRFRYALQFIEMERSQEKALIKLIYRFQREFLRRRLPVEG
jgi:c-di-GMP-binding flagellar brake protein YcgR